MEAVLWKALPVKNPEQVRLLSWASGLKNGDDSSWGGRHLTPAGVSSTVFSYPVFQEMQRKTTGTLALFAFKPSGRITAVIDGHEELVTSELVSGNIYDSIGVALIAGRPISPADDVRNSAGAVAVISDNFWSRRFGREASALSKQISLNQVPLTIIGVNPPDCRLTITRGRRTVVRSSLRKTRIAANRSRVGRTRVSMTTPFPHHRLHEQNRTGEHGRIWRDRNGIPNGRPEFLDIWRRTPAIAFQKGFQRTTPRFA
jgi:hypothetical protein